MSASWRPRRRQPKLIEIADALCVQSRVRNAKLLEAHNLKAKGSILCPQQLWTEAGNQSLHMKW
jgi:hypothetical protein